MTREIEIDECRSGQLCGAPIGIGKKLCTRPAGHDGQHICTELRGSLVLPDTSNTTTDPVTGLEVLPCPFCGGPASVEESRAYEGAAFSVGCDADEASCYGYQSLTTFSRRSDAIAGWNRRGGRS